jgi:arylformamidase
MGRFDVSMPLFVGMPAFPGDPEFASQPDHALSRGDVYNVSRLSFGSHAGTHVDPPLHFIEGSKGTDRLDLETLNGPAVVVAVDPLRTVIEPPDLAGVPEGSRRVLFRTANSPRWAKALSFFADFVALSPAAADEVVRRRIGLVGIDALSIESDLSGRFPVHHRLLGEGIIVLEGLLLAEAPAGAYELECLPLRIRGGDGGPSRAVLRSL